VISPATRWISASHHVSCCDARHSLIDGAQSLIEFAGVRARYGQKR
jgi:hypothetical protein